MFPFYEGSNELLFAGFGGLDEDGPAPTGDIPTDTEGEDTPEVNVTDEML